MKLEYLKNGVLLVSDASNNDVDILVKEDGPRKTISLLAKENITLVSATISNHFEIHKKDLYFLNGYQSWTESQETEIGFKERNALKIPKPVLNRYVMQMYGDATFYPHTKTKLHGYDIYYEKGNHEAFSYSLNYKNAYLVYEILKGKKQLNLISQVANKALKKGESYIIFDYKWFDSYEEGIKSFDIDFPKLNKEKVFGYTSWYNYYQNINESIILRDLDALDNRFNLFQIDDGYETFVGDWMDIDAKKFPNGLKEVVDKIHQKGLKAGIWLAPFIAEVNSKVVKEHPDWIKLDPSGNKVAVSGSWSTAYALDLSKKEVWDYIEQCFKYFIDLGFDFYKLDFLYGSSTYLYDNETRAESAYKAYSHLREILKDRIILGCGANILSSYLNFDYLRIGPDVSLKFDDVWFMKFMHRERISTKITVQNSIYRSFYNDHLFGNDPDVFLLRDENISLTEQQKEALITINALFGSVLMTSDDIATYNDKKKELLNKSLDLYLHANNKQYKKEGNNIVVNYELNGNKHSFVYNIMKGTIIHG